LLTIFIIEVRTELRRADEDAMTLSEIVADSAISPLRFRRSQVARTLLASLRYHERVATAMLVRRMVPCLQPIPPILGDDASRLAALQLRAGQELGYVQGGLLQLPRHPAAASAMVRISGPGH
jgi:hypothetical protein